MTPQEKSDRAFRAWSESERHLAEALEALRPTLQRLYDDLKGVVAELREEERRRRHPRITANLARVNRRYRRRT